MLVVLPVSVSFSRFCSVKQVSVVGSEVYLLFYPAPVVL